MTTSDDNDIHDDMSVHCGAMAPECDIKVSRVKVCYSKERSKDDATLKFW